MIRTPSNAFLPNPQNEPPKIRNRCYFTSVSGEGLPKTCIYFLQCTIYIVSLSPVACPAGFMVDLISDPVTSGFTSAYSVMIAVSQLKGLLGLGFKAHGFVDTVRQLCAHLHEARLADSLLGGGCVVVLLAMKVQYSRRQNYRARVSG